MCRLDWEVHRRGHRTRMRRSIYCSKANRSRSGNLVVCGRSWMNQSGCGSTSRNVTMCHIFKNLGSPIFTCSTPTIIVILLYSSKSHISPTQMRWISSLRHSAPGSGSARKTVVFEIYQVAVGLYPPSRWPNNSQSTQESSILDLLRRWISRTIRFAIAPVMVTLQAQTSPNFQNLEHCNVELRRHHTRRIMRWAPRIISKDNGAVKKQRRGCRLGRTDCLGDNGWLKCGFKHCLNEWARFLILLHSILIYIVLWSSLKIFSLLFRLSFRSEEEDEEEEQVQVLSSRIFIM